MTPLLAETHGHLGFRPGSDFSFARQVTRLPLAVWDVARTAQAMPVVFEQDHGHWRAVAVMGSSQGTNAYVAPDGRWCAEEVPVSFRLYPFCIDANGRLCLVDGYKAEHRDQPGVVGFFDGPELTARMKQTLHYLSARKKGLTGVEPALQILHDCNALIAFDTAVARRFAFDTPRGSAFALDQDRLATLDDDTALSLYRSGALRWLHAHLDSLHHLDRLDRKAKAVRAAPLPQVSAPTYVGPGADVMSSLAEDMGDADLLSIPRGSFA